MGSAAGVDGMGKNNAPFPALPGTIRGLGPVSSGQFFFVSGSRRSHGVLAIKFNGLLESDPKGWQTFFAGSLLAVYTRDLLYPTDPPIAPLFDYCSIFWTQGVLLL